MCPLCLSSPVHMGLEPAGTSQGSEEPTESLKQHPTRMECRGVSCTGLLIFSSSLCWMRRRPSRGWACPILTPHSMSSRGRCQTGLHPLPLLGITVATPWLPGDCLSEVSLCFPQGLFQCPLALGPYTFSMPGMSEVMDTLCPSWMVWGSPMPQSSPRSRERKAGSRACLHSCINLIRGS